MKFVNYITIVIVSLVLVAAGNVQAQTFGERAKKAVEKTRATVRLPSARRETPPPAKLAPRPAEAPAQSAPSTAAGTPAAPIEKKSSDLVYLNVQDQDIKDVIKQISKATSKNFIIDNKVRGKVTIISEQMMTQEEAYQAFLSALEVAGFTVVTGPGGIIKVVALKTALSSPIPIHVDSTPYTDSFITRLIGLNNISANDMANAIKGLVSKSGNLFAYPATNTLIITDSGTNIDRLMKLIKELDQEGPQEVVEIIPVFYADAKDVAAKVLQLFEIQKSATATRTTRRARGAAASAQLTDIKAVSKIIADDRTNSIIVLANKRSIDSVRNIIKKLDKPLDEGESGGVHVHYLKHANAADMAATLSSLTSGASASARTTASKGKSGTKVSATKTTSVARFEGGISVAADESTNALIITASARDYELLVKDLIAKLDIPRRQVYLESIVMELTMRKAGEYGVSAFGGGGSGSVLGFGQTFGALSGLMSPSSFFSQGGLLGGAFGRDTITINIPTISGTAQQATIPSFAAFLNLVQTYADTNVVSTPNILTLDNEEAEITVTRKEYANSDTTTATGIITTTPVPLEAGLTLKITPQISEGDMVRLKIQHELSNFEEKPADAPASPQRARKINTTVMAADGQTVVLGGLMEDIVSTTKSKVPILGDIPILGWLFRQKRNVTSKSNMLVFITPHVIRDPSDFSEVLKRKIDQRNQFVSENYGRKQQEAIRDVIRSHRADLIEYVPPPPPAPPTPPAPLAGTTGAAGKPLATAPKATSSVPAKPGVITVPSPDSYRGTTRAYPSSSAVESSRGKPVTQPGSTRVEY